MVRTGILRVNSQQPVWPPRLFSGIPGKQQCKKRQKSKQPEKAAAFPKPLPRDGWDRAVSWLLACECQEPSWDISGYGSPSALQCRSTTNTQSRKASSCATAPQPGRPWNSSKATGQGDRGAAAVTRTGSCPLQRIHKVIYKPHWLLGRQHPVSHFSFLPPSFFWVKDVHMMPRLLFKHILNLLIIDSFKSI